LTANILGHRLRTHLACTAEDQHLTVARGQRLGIKEVDDGIWLASFMHYDLGYFDLEQKTLQLPDNPFGTRFVTHVLGYNSVTQCPGWTTECVVVDAVICEPLEFVVRKKTGIF